MMIRARTCPMGEDNVSVEAHSLILEPKGRLERGFQEPERFDPTLEEAGMKIMLRKTKKGN